MPRLPASEYVEMRNGKVCVAPDETLDRLLETPGEKAVRYPHFLYEGC
jgi:hypothetical protein